MHFSFPADRLWIPAKAGMTVFSNGVCGAFISARKLSTYQSYEVQKNLSFPRRRESRKPLYFIRIGTAISTKGAYCPPIWMVWRDSHNLPVPRPIIPDFLRMRVKSLGFCNISQQFSGIIHRSATVKL